MHSCQRDLAAWDSALLAAFAFEDCKNFIRTKIQMTPARNILLVVCHGSASEVALLHTHTSHTGLHRAGHLDLIGLLRLSGHTA